MVKSLNPLFLPWLEEIEDERKTLNPDNPWLGFGSVELCWAFGDRIKDETSLLHQVAKHRIPVVIPGLSDGSIERNYSCIDKISQFYDRFPR